MGRFLYLLNTVETPKSISHPQGGHQIDVIDQYDFSPTDLLNVDGILFSQHLDETHLGAYGDAFQAYIDQGGSAALNGPVAQPFLDPPGRYYSLPSTAAKDWVVELCDPHPITAGVRAEDLTARKGVIGFWARGYFDLPANAFVLSRFVASRKPADWIWQSDGGGVVLAHPGNDFWTYESEETTAARLFKQYLDWVMAR